MSKGMFFLKEYGRQSPNSYFKKNNKNPNLCPCGFENE
jgi:hypothetical protein